MKKCLSILWTATGMTAALSAAETGTVYDIPVLRVFFKCFDAVTLFCDKIAVTHPLLGFCLFYAFMIFLLLIVYLFFCYGVRCIRAFFNF